MKINGGINNYKKEIIITDRLTDKGILDLHATCDCFVMPSYGESWSLPNFDSMAMGKTPIATNCGGFKEYLSEAEGWLVDCHEEQVFGVTDSFGDLYTANEYWSSINIKQLRSSMRQAFSEESIRKEKSLKGQQRAYDFSYENLGKKMREVLEYERTG